MRITTQCEICGKDVSHDSKTIYRFCSKDCRKKKKIADKRLRKLVKSNNV